MTTKQTILTQLADEAQHVAKTTTIDLDAFLALPTDARARRWRQFDRAAKDQLVKLAMERRCGEWRQDVVDARIAEWDARFALPPVEAAVEGALERLAESHQRSAETADTAEARRYFRRWAGAFRKALLLYREGLRPEQLASGAWLVPSATRAIVHAVNKDGACSCEAGTSGCWHAALVTGIEVGFDALDSGVSGEPEPEGEPPVDDGPDDNWGAFRAHLAIGAYARELLLTAMLDRSAAQIAALAAAPSAPAPGSHDYYCQLAARRRAADRPKRPLSGYAARDAETARRAQLAEERQQLRDRIAAARAARLAA